MVYQHRINVVLWWKFNDWNFNIESTFNICWGEGGGTPLLPPLLLPFTDWTFNIESMFNIYSMLFQVPEFLASHCLNLIGWLSHMTGTVSNSNIHRQLQGSGGSSAELAQKNCLDKTKRNKFCWTNVEGIFKGPDSRDLHFSNWLHYTLWRRILEQR